MPAPDPLAPFLEPLERLGLPYCITGPVAASVYDRVDYVQYLWNQWFRRTMLSGTASLQTFAQRLKSHLGGLFAHCYWPLGTDPSSRTLSTRPES